MKTKKVPPKKKGAILQMSSTNCLKESYKKVANRILKKNWENDQELEQMIFDSDQINQLIKKLYLMIYSKF